MNQPLAISLSIDLVLAAIVWLLYRYAGLKAWHGVLCVLLGFFLATSSFAPQIRAITTAIIGAVTGH